MASHIVFVVRLLDRWNNLYTTKEKLVSTIDQQNNEKNPEGNDLHMGDVVIVTSTQLQAVSVCFCFDVNVVFVYYYLAVVIIIYKQ